MICIQHATHQVALALRRPRRILPLLALFVVVCEVALFGGRAAVLGARVAPAAVPHCQMHLPPLAGALLKVALGRVVATVGAAHGVRVRL